MFFMDHRTPYHALEELLQLDKRQLSALKVRSGEHLAAILLTMFLGTKPVRIDTHGEVDLEFELTQPFEHMSPQSGVVAFEVKSMPGRFRKFQSELSYARSNGKIDPIERSFSAKVETANQTLGAADLVIAKASKSLIGKLPEGASRNVFVVAHSFDHPVAEAHHLPLLSHVLQRRHFANLDTVWIYWAPNHLTFWSSLKREWIDLLLTKPDLTRPLPEWETPLTIIQDVEFRFLDALGHQFESPFAFSLSSRYPE